MPDSTPLLKETGEPDFAPDGTPTDEIVATAADRLANWRRLQELAGIEVEG